MRTVVLYQSPVRETSPDGAGEIPLPGRRSGGIDKRSEVKLGTDRLTSTGPNVTPEDGEDSFYKSFLINSSAIL
jgi:hypothetical protein